MQTNIFLEILDALSNNAWNKWAAKQKKKEKASFNSTKLKEGTQ
jgi:hypothetical protein